MNPKTPIKFIVPVIALAIAGLHAGFPDKIKVDSITLGLIVIALLPWIGNLVESLKYGDLEVKLRNLEAKADEAKGAAVEAKGAAESARNLAIAPAGLRAAVPTAPPDVAAPGPTALGQPQATPQMEPLIKEYSEKRNSNPPGDFRTTLMADVVRRMIAAAPAIDPASVLPWLSHQDHAHRLAAYAFLDARPDFSRVDALVNSITNPDNPPFAQYWGIMALRNVIGARGKQSVPEKTVAELQKFLARLQPGTDRHYELSRILSSIRGA
jgi:hypothetical protein